MKLRLQSSGLDESESFRKTVEDKIRLALGRLSHRIRSVTVQFSDINGPKGGEDIRCRVETLLHPRGSLHVEETRSAALDAVHRAALRTRRSLARRLDRERTRRRTVPAVS